MVAQALPLREVTVDAREASGGLLARRPLADGVLEPLARRVRELSSMLGRGERELMTRTASLELTDARVEACLVRRATAHVRVDDDAIAHVARRAAHAFVGPRSFGTRGGDLGERCVTALARA